MPRFPNLESCPLLYCTPSLGMHPSHTLVRKLDAISSAGYTGIELGFDDMLAYGRQQHSAPALLQKSEEDMDELIDTSDFDTYYDHLATIVAPAVRTLCHRYELDIFCLQPFAMYEGYEGRKAEQKLKKADKWLQIMEKLGCSTLQVGSSPDPEIKNDAIIPSLQNLADLAAKYSSRIAYENWCWSIHAPTWEDVWSICKQVDRENFGLCLDTFQTAGAEIADPSTESGWKESASRVRWEQSMSRLAKQVDPNKIFYFQISDAFRPRPRITQNHEEFTPSQGIRGVWSHSCRPLPYEEGKNGYLPWKKVCEAVFATGARCPISMEVFQDTMKDQDFDLDAYAKQGVLCWKRMQVDLQSGTGGLGDEFN